MSPPGGGLSRNRLIAIGAIVALVIVGIAVLAFRPGGPGAALTGNYGSGASPSPSASAKPTPTPTPDDPAKAPTTTMDFSGTDALYNIGLSTNNIDALRYAYNKWGKAANMNLVQVAVKDGTVKTRPRYRNDPGRTIEYDVVVNATDTYHSVVSISNTTAIDLYINKPPSTTVIYHSGVIDLFHGVGD
jgi:hypothetical protein